jgi:hypothetical protein
MYTVDNLDVVLKLSDTPWPDVGAPLPAVLCDENKLFLAYFISTQKGIRTTAHPIEVSPRSAGVPIALVHFVCPFAHMLGPPNDEAFAGHPLACRGLEPYSVFEVEQSSWIRQLERMNAIHPNHNSDLFFCGRRHFVFTFHDSTFEVVAEDFKVQIVSGSMHSALITILKRLCEGD